MLRSVRERGGGRAVRIQGDDLMRAFGFAPPAVGVRVVAGAKSLDSESRGQDGLSPPEKIFANRVPETKGRSCYMPVMYDIRRAKTCRPS